MQHYFACNPKNTNEEGNIGFTRHPHILAFLIILFLMLQMGIHTAQAGSKDTVKKEIASFKTEHPPILDGTLDDSCWQKAPQAVGFTDERTEEPAKNQSVARLVYTDKAIYVALHLYDEMPDKIVVRQTKDQTSFRGEDWVSFHLDLFHTHQLSDRNFFMVNPIGTKYAHIATGRAEKSEWIGHWEAAAQIVEDGWRVEMKIPWQMLDYPDTTQPIRIGINFERSQQRTGEHSWWCNIGVNEFHENDGHWVDVLLPPRKRNQKLLGYLTASIDKTQKKDEESPVRMGADIRYEVTPQLRLIGTIKPDFENIEQEVEGIDFSYGERFISDKRPFFLEGGHVYSLGPYFHSPRIRDIDGGLKLFGKVGRNTSVGGIGTYHPKNQNVLLLVSQPFTATSALSAAFLSQHAEDTGENHIGYLSGDLRHGKLSASAHIAQSWATEDLNADTGFASFTYNGQLVQHFLFAFFVDPDFVNRLGYHPFTNFRGISFGSILENEWRQGLLRSVDLYIQSEISHTYEGEIFRRILEFSSRILTHSDYSLSATWSGGQFGEFSDNLFHIGLGLRASDRFNTISGGYTWGEQAGRRIHRVHGNVNFRADRLTTRITTQIQWHFEKRSQQILTLTYDFNPALSFGTRFIWQVEGRNIYFTLRRSGYAGTNFFVILGDPNALEFKQKLLVKGVQAF